MKPFDLSIGNQAKVSGNELPPKEREFELRKVSDDDFELYDNVDNVVWFSHGKHTNYKNFFQLKVGLTPQEAWLLAVYTEYIPADEI